MLLKSFSYSLIITCFTLVIGTSPSSAQNPRRGTTSVIDPNVERIYHKGLRFLAKSQASSGSWASSPYNDNPGLTGLCVLSFLAHGDDPNHSEYAPNIKKGIDFIIKSQTSNGQYISPNKKCMYTHGFAMLALAEAYGMVEDQRIGKSLKKAVAFAVTNQNKVGGWRYTPGDNSADLSIVGCQLVAFYAARNAGIPVPEKTLERAFKYVETCRTKEGAYGYVSKSTASASMTSVGLLCHYLAKDTEEDHIAKSVGYLKKNINQRATKVPFYLEYYMSQALFQADLELWGEWNKKQIDYLRLLQQPDGSFNSRMGKPFATSSSLLSLALNYRFLPIYEK